MEDSGGGFLEAVALSLLLKHRLAGGGGSAGVNALGWRLSYLGPVCWVRFLSPQALRPPTGSLSGALGREGELWHPVVETLVMPERPGSLQRACVEEGISPAPQPVSVSPAASPLPAFPSSFLLPLFAPWPWLPLSLLLPPLLSPLSRFFSFLSGEQRQSVLPRGMSSKKLQF